MVKFQKTYADFKKAYDSGEFDPSAWVWRILKHQLPEGEKTCIFIADGSGERYIAFFACGDDRPDVAERAKVKVKRDFGVEAHIGPIARSSWP